MDKFGIFKLLNSFFNFYNQSNTTNTQQTNTQNPSLTDFVSSFINNSTAQQKQTLLKQSAPEQTPKTTQPLQSYMLGVMSSHDKFIQRVKEKKKPTR